MQSKIFSALLVGAALTAVSLPSVDAAKLDSYRAMMDTHRCTVLYENITPAERLHNRDKIQLSMWAKEDMADAPEYVSVSFEKVEKVDGDGLHEGTHFTLGTPEGGTLSQAEFDDKVANLVAFMKFMSDPSASTRGRLGIRVLLFIALFVGCTWWLNREYWKDVK